MTLPKIKLSFTAQIFVGMAIGVGLGIAFHVGALGVIPEKGDYTGLLGVFEFVADVFLRLLKMLIIPLIVTSMIVGMANMKDVGRLGRIGGQTVGIYMVTTVVAVIIGLTLVNLIQPGQYAEPDKGFIPEEVGAHKVTIYSIFINMIPDNFVGAMANGQILPVVFFSLLFGYSLLLIGETRAAPVTRVFVALNNAVMAMTNLVMKLAPYGVGALIVVLLARFDNLVQLVQSVGMYMVTVVLALAIHVGFYMYLVSVAGKVSPLRYLRHMAPMLSTAFSTASSSATLPVTFECVEAAGVSKRVRGFVLPIGATVNMDGTALYEAVAALFIAQMFGIHLSLGQQILVFLTSMGAAVGAAGIPSAGLVTMAAVLSAVGLPLEGIGLILAVDRILDMCRTAVNVLGDSVACRVVQTWNPGQTDELETDKGPAMAPGEVEELV